MISVHLLLVVAAMVAPGPQAVAVSWAKCENGEPADLRVDIPVLVLTTSSPEVPVPFLTGLVLYADGRLLVRRGGQMTERRGDDRRVAELWKLVSGDELFRLEDKFDRITSRQRTLAGHAYDYVVPGTEIHVWKEGCHKRIVVAGLDQLVAAEIVTHRRFIKPSAEELADARTVLASLPPVLSKAIQGMLGFRPNGGKRWCELESCSSTDNSLPFHELWDPPRTTAAERDRRLRALAP